MFRFVRLKSASNSNVVQSLRHLRNPLLAKSIASGCRDGKWKEVIDYWFGPGAETKWFGGGEQVDNEIKSKFGQMVEEAHQGGMPEWEQEPLPSLALIILTDQFSRSIFRGSSKSFDGDKRARKLTRKFLERKTHDHLKCTFPQRSFIYMPMEHSEDAADQELSVALCERLAKDAQGTPFAEGLKNFLEFAVRHKEVIDKFGRYPQRNKTLGRNNTAEEDAFLRDIPERYKW